MTRKELEHIIFVLTSVRAGEKQPDPFWRVEIQEALASCRAELEKMPEEESKQLELNFGQQNI